MASITDINIANGVTTATIDDIKYNNITRKIITSKDIYSDNLQLDDKFALDNKINVIDLDWNGAVTSLGELNNTSDLIKIINKLIKKIEEGNYLPFDEYSNYTYFFEDDNGILSDYMGFSGNVNFTKNSIAPKHATKIGVYNIKGMKIGYISLVNKTFTLKKYHVDDTPNFTVGLLSDIHYNDLCLNNLHEIGSTSNGNEYYPYEDLENALSIFKQREHIDFICAAGDITTDNVNHLKTFRQSIDKNLPDIPFFSCKGNHDNNATYGNPEMWLNYMLPINNEVYSSFNPIMFNSGDGTSFYFMKDTDMYIFFNVDYGGNSSHALEYTNKFGETDLQYYAEDTIQELQELLERNKNNRTFVFTHHFLPNKAGSPWNDYQTTNYHEHNYYLTGLQFGVLNQMNNYYKNSIWFSGHSHYKWNIQSLAKSDRANICNWDYLNNNYKYDDYYTFAKINDESAELYSDTHIKSAFNVHIPSLSRPLRLTKLTGTKYDIENPGAEGAIMDVYDDGILLRGITFCDENSANTNIPVLETKDAILKIDVSKDGYSEDQEAYVDDDGFITIRFTQQTQCVYVTNFSSSKYFIFTDLHIFDDDGNDLTDELLSKDNPKIGLYTGSSPDYSLKNCNCVYTKSGKENQSDESNSLGGLEIPCSSTYSGKLPITLKIKGAWHVYNTLYGNNYVPECNYWIPIPKTNSLLYSNTNTIDDFYNEVINIKNNYI